MYMILAANNYVLSTIWVNALGPETNENETIVHSHV